MAPLYHELRRHPQAFETIACITAQHREMLDQVLKTFEIKPDIDLNLMKKGQDLFDITAEVTISMRDVIAKWRPDALLVHGDTTTALAASMAGFYANLPIGHIEAGLRTYDLYAPFPEEFNRQVISKIAKWHFAPTKKSKANLIAEKVDESDIAVTGNTVIDALYWVLGRIKKDPSREAGLVRFLDQLLNFNWQVARIVMITGHRRENFGDGFMQICEALRELSAAHREVHFVYPVHLNPNVQIPVNKILAGINNVHLIPPLDYEPFVFLLSYAYIVLTDSGGIQEEAPSLGKPVLVMRDVTERPEAVDAGTVELVGANKNRIVEKVTELLLNQKMYEEISHAHNPYGDGSACTKIVGFLKGINNEK